MAALAIAHRAGNSLAGMHGANELGVDVIKADIHHYRGRLEVRHLRTAGPLPFLWDRGQLVSAFAPRFGLHELLEADEHGTLFMLDLKGPWTWTGRAVARLLHDGGHHRPVLVCGRWWPSIDAMAHLPYVLPVLSARNRVEMARLWRRLDRGPKPHGVSVHRSLLDRQIVGGLHRHVEVVMPGPVHDQVALDEVLGFGVSGVISDEPGILAEVVARP